jgi:DNA-binding NarL/FixJ family response regulator
VTTAADFTPLELQILELASEGMTFPAMAPILGTSRHVLKQKSIGLRQKLGADNLTQACCMALRRQIIK